MSSRSYLVFHGIHAKSELAFTLPIGYQTRYQQGMARRQMLNRGILTKRLNQATFELGSIQAKRIHAEKRGQQTGFGHIPHENDIAKEAKAEQRHLEIKGFQLRQYH